MSTFQPLHDLDAAEGAMMDRIMAGYQASKGKRFQFTFVRSQTPEFDHVTDAEFREIVERLRKRLPNWTLEVSSDNEYCVVTD